MGRDIEEIQAVIDNLRRVFQAINEHSKNAINKTGLTGPQLWAIKILDKESPIRVSDLARRMFLHPATVVGILDRLAQKDLITRVRSKEDRRAVDLYLTDLGKKIVVDAPEVTQTMLIDGLSRLTDDQLRCVSDGMRLMVGMLDAEKIKPQPLQGNRQHWDGV